MPAVPKPWVDVASTIADLSGFFNQRARDLTKFGSTVNQTFEAYLFASTVSHYRQKGWTVDIRNPVDKSTKKEQFRLKFSTSGIPKNFSFAVCTRDGKIVELRHQLKVSTAHHKDGQSYNASVCLDLAVIESGFADALGNDDPAENSALITFAEAKHMNAFAELVAGFVGLVHEMQPERMKRRKFRLHADHECPFLFISGYLLRTARGILETIERRKLDMAIYHMEKPLPGELKRRIGKAAALPPPAKKAKATPRKAAKKGSKKAASTTRTKAASTITIARSSGDKDVPF